MRTSGQVCASGCGLEPGSKIKSKIRIQQSHSSHPLPAMCWESSSSGDQEALRLLSPCLVPNNKKTQATKLYYFAGPYFKPEMAATNDSLGKTWHHSGTANGY